jgi:hypothetical protein
VKGPGLDDGIFLRGRLAKSNSHLSAVPATNLQLRLESQRESYSSGMFLPQSYAVMPFESFNKFTMRTIALCLCISAEGSLRNKVRLHHMKPYDLTSNKNPEVNIVWHLPITCSEHSFVRAAQPTATQPHTHVHIHMYIQKAGRVDSGKESGWRW